MSLPPPISALSCGTGADPASPTRWPPRADAARACRTACSSESWVFAAAGAQSSQLPLWDKRAPGSLGWRRQGAAARDGDGERLPIGRGQRVQPPQHAPRSLVLVEEAAQAQKQQR